MNQINFFSICADVLFDSNNSISSCSFHTDFSIFFSFSTISFLIGKWKENFIFQPICTEFEQRWVSKNLHTENLISIGSNTLHNLARLPWEPGIMRPEMFGHYSGLYQVVDYNNSCTAECSIQKIVTQTEPFPIAGYI